jgi:hypothetical protein
MPIPNIGDHHPSPNIDYKTGLDQDWSDTWLGAKFHHVPNNPAFGPVHDDEWINYKTWDNSSWFSTWNAVTGRFVHHAGSTNGLAHEDVVLNYLTWDGSKWAAVRDGNGFVHVYVAPPGDGNSNLLGKIVNAVSQAGQIIQVLIANYPA